MSSEKVIQVNPDYLQLKGKSKSNSSSKSITRKKQIRQKPASSTTLKKEFIQMIKQKKANQGIGNEDDSSSAVKHIQTGKDCNDKDSEFLSSLKDLNKIISSHKSRKQRRSHSSLSFAPVSPIKTIPNDHQVVPVQLETFDNMVTQNSQNDIIPLIPRSTYSPKYGLLKNGKKPLFSQLNKTMKRNVSFPDDSPVCSVTTCDKIDKVSIQNETNLRKQRLMQLQKKENEQSNNINSVQYTSKHNSTPETTEEMEAKLDSIIERRYKNSMYGLDPLDNKISVHPAPTPNPQPMKTKKQVKRLQKTCKIGKKGRSVNVLIDNNKTRRRIMNDINKLDKISITKMKEYLREKGLIQKGSDAPDFIIKQLYKSAIMTGSVENTNKTHLINEINSSLMEMDAIHM